LTDPALPGSPLPSQPSLFDGGSREPDEQRAPGRPRFPVRVIRSAKRRRSAHAQLVDGEIVVRIPARMSKADEAVYVAELVERIEKREQRSAVDIEARTKELARRYDLPLPGSIRFVDNQNSRWGSCTIDTRDIRISSKLVSYPLWVLDYVIVHELAHLLVADHSPAVHALVDRYPKAERARGYLMAKSDGV
jgi:predicted metal-dependent hydrolase